MADANDAPRSSARLVTRAAKSSALPTTDPERPHPQESAGDAVVPSIENPTTSQAQPPPTSQSSTALALPTTANAVAHLTNPGELYQVIRDVESVRQLSKLTSSYAIDSEVVQGALYNGKHDLSRVDGAISALEDAMRDTGDIHSAVKAIMQHLMHTVTAQDDHLAACLTVCQQLGQTLLGADGLQKLIKGDPNVNEALKEKQKYATRRFNKAQELDNLLSNSFPFLLVHPYFGVCPQPDAAPGIPQRDGLNSHESEALIHLLTIALEKRWSDQWVIGVINKSLMKRFNENYDNAHTMKTLWPTVGDFKEAFAMAKVQYTVGVDYVTVTDGELEELNDKLEKHSDDRHRTGKRACKNDLYHVDLDYTGTLRCLRRNQFFDNARDGWDEEDLKGFSIPPLATTVARVQTVTPSPKKQSAKRQRSATPVEDNEKVILRAIDVSKQAPQATQDVFKRVLSNLQQKKARLADNVAEDDLDLGDNLPNSPTKEPATPQRAPKKSAGKKRKPQKILGAPAESEPEDEDDDMDAEDDGPAPGSDAGSEQQQDEGEEDVNALVAEVDGTAQDEDEEDENADDEDEEGSPHAPQYTGPDPRDLPANEHLPHLTETVEDPLYHISNSECGCMPEQSPKNRGADILWCSAFRRKVRNLKKAGNDPSVNLKSLKKFLDEIYGSRLRPCNSHFKDVLPLFGIAKAGAENFDGQELVDWLQDAQKAAKEGDFMKWLTTPVASGPGNVLQKFVVPSLLPPVPMELGLLNRSLPYALEDYQFELSEKKCLEILESSYPGSTERFLGDGFVTLNLMDWLNQEKGLNLELSEDVLYYARNYQRPLGMEHTTELWNSMHSLASQFVRADPENYMVSVCLSLSKEHRVLAYPMPVELLENGNYQKPSLQVPYGFNHIDQIGWDALTDSVSYLNYSIKAKPQSKTPKPRQGDPRSTIKGGRRVLDAFVPGFGADHQKEFSRNFPSQTQIDMPVNRPFTDDQRHWMESHVGPIRIITGDWQGHTSFVQPTTPRGTVCMPPKETQVRLVARYMPMKDGKVMGKYSAAEAIQAATMRSSPSFLPNGMPWEYIPRSRAGPILPQNFLDMEINPVVRAYLNGGPWDTLPVIAELKRLFSDNKAVRDEFIEQVREQNLAVFRRLREQSKVSMYTANIAAAEAVHAADDAVEDIGPGGFFKRDTPRMAYEFVDQYEKTLSTWNQPWHTRATDTKPVRWDDGLGQYAVDHLFEPHLNEEPHFNNGSNDAEEFDKRTIEKIA